MKSPGIAPRFAAHLLLAIGAAAVAMTARRLLDAWLGDAVPFVFALPAVFMVGWFAAMVPAAVCAGVAVVWLLIPFAPTLSPVLAWRSMK